MPALALTGKLSINFMQNIHLNFYELKPATRKAIAAEIKQYGVCGSIMDQRCYCTNQNCAEWIKRIPF